MLSYGRKNRYGHPAPEVKERLKEAGSEILETGKSGAVMIRTDGKKIRVRTMIRRNDKPAAAGAKTLQGIHVKRNRGAAYTKRNYISHICPIDRMMDHGCI